MAEFISYAQNGEDVVLARAFSHQERGTFVDVGAAHPINDSVTYALYQRGWRGVNIEPNPELFDDLEQIRSGDRNLNVGVSDTAGQLIFWRAPAEAWGRSTFSEAAALELEAEGHVVLPAPVAVITLAEVLEELPGPVDVLKVDVEGFETEVLAGAELGRYRPKVLLVEAIDPGTKRRRRQPWEQLVAEHGYEETLFDGVNVFYVHATARHLAPALAVPANVTDEYELWRHLQNVAGMERHLDLARHLAARELARAVREATGLDADRTIGLEGICAAVLADTPEIAAYGKVALAEVVTVDRKAPAGSRLSGKQRSLAGRLAKEYGEREVMVQR